MRGKPGPICYDLLHGHSSRIQIIDESKAALPWKIFCRSGIFGNHRTSHRQKHGGAIAEPAGSPRHINPFYRSELGAGGGKITSISERSLCRSMRIDDMPTAVAQTRTLRIIATEVHCQLEPRLLRSGRQIEVFFKGHFLRKVGKLAIYFDSATPIDRK